MQMRTLSKTFGLKSHWESRTTKKALKGLKVDNVER